MPLLRLYKNTMNRKNVACVSVNNKLNKVLRTYKLLSDHKNGDDIKTMGNVKKKLADNNAVIKKHIKAMQWLFQIKHTINGKFITLLMITSVLWIRLH